MIDFKVLTSNIITFLKDGGNNNLKAPKGICPNCWGREEYGGNFYTRMKNHGIDINSPNPEVGWINDYVEKNLAPIALFKEDDKHYCSTCKMSFHIED